MPFKLYNSDCLEVLDKLPDNCIDCCISDLPYGVLSKSNKDAEWDCKIDLNALWPKLLRVVKDNGVIALFGQGKFAAELIFSNPTLYKYDLIWDKVRVSGFLNAKKQPLRSHEQILIFYKKQPTYNPQMVRCEPHQRNHSRGSGVHKATNRCYGEFKEAADFISDEKYPKSIITIGKEHKEFYHPTQKPVELLEYLIKTYTNKGETVLDCTMGSGSTGVACKNLGRNFVGIELNKEYFCISKTRIYADKKGNCIKEREDSKRVLA